MAIRTRNLPGSGTKLNIRSAIRTSGTRVMAVMLHHLARYWSMVRKGMAERMPPMLASAWERAMLTRNGVTPMYMA